MHERSGGLFCHEKCLNYRSAGNLSVKKVCMTDRVANFVSDGLVIEGCTLGVAYFVAVGLPVT